jgi:hypothetical protein
MAGDHLDDDERRERIYRSPCNRSGSVHTKAVAKQCHHPAARYRPNKNADKNERRVRTENAGYEARYDEERMKLRRYARRPESLPPPSVDLQVSKRSECSTQYWPLPIMAK